MSQHELWFIKNVILWDSGMTDRYSLEGMIEMDKGYFTIEASQKDLQSQKAKRGNKTKSNAMVMAKSTVLQNPYTGEKER